jgi:baculoviral IAP repeat-containing protein 6
VASSMVMELKRLQRHIPALAIASAVNERLTDLIVGARIIENDSTQRFHMFSEAARRKSFEQWPHMDYKWALPDQMAQAGFYHQPSDSGDDRAMCFTCNVCLVCWEKTDEPWSEHERHSPECPFVKGEYTQNVPLSVTYATSPAVLTNGFNIMSTGDQGNIICVGNQETGEIAVWNVERQLKNCATFNIKSCEKDIVKKFDLEQDVDTTLSALCTFKKHTVFVKSASKFGTMEKGTEVFGTRIIAGVKIKNREGAAFQSDSDNKLALILYAVTETTKTSKSSVATANGNNSAISCPPSNNQKDPLASISISNILSTPKPPLDTIEERLEDDFLKFFDTDSLAMPKNKTVRDAMKAAAQADYLFTVKKKIQASKMNDNAEPSGAAKIVEENDDVICTAIQTISIVPFLFVNYEISEILPSFDNRYLLVVLKRTGLQNTSGDCPMETEESTVYSNVVEDASRNVQLILFSIEDNGLINEVPISVRILEDKDTPVEICMLPKFDTSGRLFSGSPTDSEKGVFVITCVDGSIKILSLTTLKTLSEARVDGQKFISSVYCKNLERLCGCTDKGSLHFYSFYDLDVDSSDEYDEEADATVDKVKVKDEFTQFDNATPSTSSNFMKKEDEKRLNSELIAYKKQLTINDLKTLYSLTLFDEMLTPYSAEVPGCWSELVQAQKQRRNPQHFRPGDDTHLTRTWRLHNDATTWDEHLIELSLPKTTSLGHIDFKFNLYAPCINPPAIQVTLLKQKSIGLCCRRKNSKDAAGNLNKSGSVCHDVDDNIDFNINASSSSSSAFSSIENPVLSEEYLQARNAEILAGPIELSSCMDLSDQGGMVTLVSPKLLRSKARNYLLHIKTMTDLSKEGQGKTRGM